MAREGKEEKKQQGSATGKKGKCAGTLSPGVESRQHSATVTSFCVVQKRPRWPSQERYILHTLGGKQNIAALLLTGDDICTLSPSADPFAVYYYEARPIRSYIEAARLVADLGMALAFLHSAGFMHRDVKRSNVRFTGHQAVLIDFDCATVWREGDAPLAGKAGTERWLAPEVEQGLAYTNSIDMWGLGLVLLDEILKMSYKLSVTQYCFPPTKCGLRMVLYENYTKLPPPTSAFELLCGLIAAAPQERLKAVDVPHCAFVKNNPDLH